MVLADSYGISPVPHYSGYCYRVIHYIYKAITFYGLSFQIIQLLYYLHITVLQPHYCRNNNGLGCSLFVRHYLGNHYCFLFLRVLRCFSSPGLPSINGMFRLHRNGLPHSEICGSNRICQSPQLIAAYRVLHRLWEPRHPPYALRNFFKKNELIFLILLLLFQNVKER